MSDQRNALRAAILASRPLASKLVTFFGQQIEIRQPSLADIIAQGAQQDNQSAIVNSLISYAYVPGTNEKVFEDTDKEGLLALPFGNDYVQIGKAMEELTTVNFPSTNGSSNSDPTSTS